MEPSELHEWSRHYDSTQWTVTAILTAAVGGLLVYSADHFDIVLSLGGVALTLLTGFFAASFRSLRARLHSQLPEDDIRYLRSLPMFRQWPVHITVLLVILILWLRLLMVNRPALCWLWIIGWVVCTAVVVYWARAADPAAKGLKRPDA